MNRWIMPRGAGKTTQMIYESAHSGATIVVHNKGLVNNILENAEKRKLKIPCPISFEEFIYNARGRDVKYIIDEIDCCLRTLGVTGYSYTDND